MPRRHGGRGGGTRARRGRAKGATAARVSRTTACALSPLKVARMAAALRGALGVLDAREREGRGSRRPCDAARPRHNNADGRRAYHIASTSSSSPRPPRGRCLRSARSAGESSERRPARRAAPVHLGRAQPAVLSRRALHPAAARLVDRVMRLAGNNGAGTPAGGRVVLARRTERQPRNPDARHALRVRAEDPGPPSPSRAAPSCARARAGALLLSELNLP